MAHFPPLSNLRRARKLRKWRQIDLANALNMGQGRISDLERGAAAPNVDEILAFAKIFNTSTDYILGRTNDPRPIALLDAPIENISINITQLLNSLKPEQRTELYKAAVETFKEIKLREVLGNE